MKRRRRDNYTNYVVVKSLITVSDDKDTTKNVLLEGQTKKVTSRDITFEGFWGLLLEMISSVMFGLVIHPLAQ